jgi:sn-glycerol 3-phosphate transport system permease protein
MRSDEKVVKPPTVLRKYRHPMEPSPLVKVLSHVVLTLGSAIALIPLMWMITTALKPTAEIFASGVNILPRNPTPDSFITLATRYNILRIVYNTFMVGIFTTVTQLITSVLAAYGFARYRFPLRRILLFACIAQMFIPIQIVMVSNYLLISDLGLIDRLLGIVLPQTSVGLGIFFLYQHFRLYPQSTIDSARIEGAGEFDILFRIVVPVTKPVIGAIGIIIFVNRWNQYVWPMLVLKEPDMMTLPIWLRQFMHAEAGTNFGLLMAAAALGVAPALFAYAILRQTIMDAFLESGLKG